MLGRVLAAGYYVLENEDGVMENGGRVFGNRDGFR